MPSRVAASVATFPRAQAAANAKASAANAAKQRVGANHRTNFNSASDEEYYYGSDVEAMEMARPPAVSVPADAGWQSGAGHVVRSPGLALRGRCGDGHWQQEE